MNFSFYKKYIFLSFFFISLIISLFRCVPIEDLLDPTIGEFTLQEEYNITDTIFLDVVLFDNFGIDTVQIDIKSIGGSSSLDTTLILSNDSIKARALNLEQFVVVHIPSSATLGAYELTLTVIDVSGRGKNNNVSKQFIVNGDESAPSLPNIGLDLSLNIDDEITTIDLSTNTYQACRSSTIPISGTASDNVGLKKITTYFDGFPLTHKEFDFDTDTLKEVDLATLFEDLIVIPSNITNGTTIELIFNVTDGENESSASLFFLVDCDDQLPIIENIKTNLNDTQENFIEVIQGQELSIIDGLITDNKELDSIFIYLDDNSDSNTSTVTTTLIAREIDGLSFNLSELDSISILPLLPRLGIDFYKIRIEIIDAAGNRNEKTIILNIVENQSPEIIISRVEVDGTIASNFETATITDPIITSAGSSIRLYGKITDDLEIEEYEIMWGKINNEINILDGNSNNFTFDNSTTGLINISNNANISDLYILKIYAKDILGEETEKTCYFIVQ